MSLIRRDIRRWLVTRLQADLRILDPEDGVTLITPRIVVNHPWDIEPENGPIVSVNYDGESRNGDKGGATVQRELSMQVGCHIQAANASQDISDLLDEFMDATERVVLGIRGFRRGVDPQTELECVQTPEFDSTRFSFQQGKLPSASGVIEFSYLYDHEQYQNFDSNQAEFLLGHMDVNDPASGDQILEVEQVLPGP